MTFGAPWGHLKSPWGLAGREAIGVRSHGTDAGDLGAAGHAACREAQGCMGRGAGNGCEKTRIDL